MTDYERNADVCLQYGYEIEREEVLKLKTKIDNAIGENNNGN